MHASWLRKKSSENLAIFFFFFWCGYFGLSIFCVCARVERKQLQLQSMSTYVFLIHLQLPVHMGRAHLQFPVISVFLGSWILASGRDFWMMMVKDDFCPCVYWQSLFFETYLKVVNLISVLLGSWILASSRDFWMMTVKDDFCLCVCWQSSFFETYLKVVNLIIKTRILLFFIRCNDDIINVMWLFCLNTVYSV